MDEKNSFDVLADQKATLMASRRSFLASSKGIVGAGVALGLALTGRSSSAQAQSAPTTAAAGGRRGGSCFLPGMRIQTPEREVRIEELRIGDKVLTAFGEAKPIKFIGRRELSRKPSQAWKGEGPVKISRFAIDGKAPHSDLYVSPAHAIFIDGFLVPANNLANGSNIVANAKPEVLSLTYFHIELETHEPILAEGLAVETYLRDNPDAFDNMDDYVRLYGPPGEPLTPFAPVVPYWGVRQELASHIRSVLAPVYDLRRPVDKIRDRIADRAELARAA
jgi:Hint domain